jgi:prepilin-type N-terminal cleavage/methylation domain-containing protein
MFIAEAKPARARGFTLLEITLAAAILGLMCLAIYRFVDTNITVLRVSAQESAEEAHYSGLLDLLTAQWQDLPQAAAMSGETFKFNDRPRDEVVWVCGTGPGLLTRYAGGEFTVRMRLRPMPNSNKFQLGFLRRPREALDGSDEGETWIPLIDNVNGMRIRYFHPKFGPVWMETWMDTTALPRLIEITLERPGRANWQAIVALGRTAFP